MNGSTAEAQGGCQDLIDAGTKALNDNRLDEATAHLNQAARLEPHNGKVWTMLGIAYLRLGMHNEAVSALISAAHLRPSNAATRYFLGLAYQRIGNSPGAAEQFRFALQIDPNYHEARQALGSMDLQPMQGPTAPMPPLAGPQGPISGGTWPQAQPMPSRPGTHRSAMIMEQMELQAQQRRESTARLRRGLIAFAVGMTTLLVLAAVSIPLLARAHRGSPTQVVRQYIDAKYVRKDEQAARRLTVEARMPSEAYSEFGDLMSEESVPIRELRSYVVGQPAIMGNRAVVPVELDYVDGTGEAHRETVDFVAMACGAVWRVSELQSMCGGGDMEPPTPVPPVPFSSGRG